MDVNKITGLVGTTLWDNLKEYIIESTNKATEINTIKLGEKSKERIAVDVLAKQECRVLIQAILSNIELAAKELEIKNKSYK